MASGTMRRWPSIPCGHEDEGGAQRARLSSPNPHSVTIPGPNDRALGGCWGPETRGFLSPLNWGKRIPPSLGRQERSQDLGWETDTATGTIRSGAHSPQWRVSMNTMIRALTVAGGILALAMPVLMERTPTLLTVLA